MFELEQEPSRQVQDEATDLRRRTQGPAATGPSFAAQRPPWDPISGGGPPDRTIWDPLSGAAQGQDSFLLKDPLCGQGPDPGQDQDAGPEGDELRLRCEDQSPDPDPDQGGAAADPERVRALLTPLAQALGLSPAAIPVRLDDEARRRTESLDTTGAVLGGTIYLHPQRFRPDSSDGRRVLAHEAVHIAQSRLPGPPGDLAAAEDEAEQISASLIAGERPRRPQIALSPAALAADQKPAPAPTLPKDASFQISGMKVLIRRSWMEQEAKFQPGKSGKFLLKAPGKNAEILRQMKGAGLLHWIPEARIPRIAAKLVVEGTDPEREVLIANFDLGAWALFGLPQGTEVRWRAVSDGSLQYILQLRKPESDRGELKLSLDADTKRRLYSAMEEFVKMPLSAANKDRLIAAEIKVDLSDGEVAWTGALSRTELEKLYGAQRWRTYVERGRTNPQSLAIRHGLLFDDNITVEERQEYLALVRRLGLTARAGEKSETQVTRELLLALRRLAALPEAERRGVLAALNVPAANELTTADIENAIVTAEMNRAASTLGVTLAPAELEPIVDTPVTGDIVNRGGMIQVGEEVEFFFQSSIHSAGYINPFRTPWVRVTWVAHPEGKPEVTTARGSTRHIEFRAPDCFEVRFPTAGNYVIHAFVQHDCYRPAHFSIPVQVKTEAERMNEERATAFAGMGTFTSRDTFFSDGMSTQYNLGKEFHGEVPQGSTGGRMASDAAVLAQQIADLDGLIKRYKDKDAAAYADLRAQAEKRRAALQRIYDDLAGNERDGWLFLDARAAYISRQNGVPDCTLKIVAAAKRVSVLGGLGAQVRVMIRDFTQAFEPKDYEFSNGDQRFYPALRGAFLDLCKHYPPGRMSFLCQELSEDGTRRLGRTIGFELDTGTTWKDIKGVLYHPAVQTIVNIGGALAMIFIPGSGAILFPVLAAYNIAGTVDRMIDQINSGTMDRVSFAEGVMEIGLNLLPALGHARFLGSLGKIGSAVGKAARTWWVIDGAIVAGNGVMMTTEALRRLEHLRDHDIQEIARLNAEVEQLESFRTTNPSFPDLKQRLEQKKQQLQAKITETRGRGKEIFADLVKQGAIMLGQVAGFRALGKVAMQRQVTGLVKSGAFEHRPGLKDPFYDPIRGRMVGDQTSVTPEQLARMQEAHEGEMARRQRQLAEALETEPDKVQIERGGTRTQIEPGKGKTVTVRIPPDRPLDLAIEDVRAQRRGGKAAPPPPGAPELRAPIEPTFRAAEIVAGSNIRVGNTIKSESVGRALLERLASGDRGALSQVGAEVPPATFDPRACEWGLGQIGEHYILVRGEMDQVNWGLLPGVKGVAHSHPVASWNRLQRGDATGRVRFADLVANKPEERPNVVHVFPSSADVAYSANHGIPEHTVQTPFVYVGEGHIANQSTHAGKGPLLRFRILSAEQAGTVRGAPDWPIYKCRLIAEAGGAEVWSGEIYTMSSGAGPMIEFKPPSIMEPIAPGQARPPAKGTTQQGKKLPTPRNAREERALSDYLALERSDRPYEGKFESVEEWFARYNEGREYDLQSRVWKGGPGADRPPEIYQPGEAERAYRELTTRDSSSFKPFSKMLLGEGLATEAELRAQVQEMLSGGTPRSEDYIRHRLKETFGKRVLARIATPTDAEAAALRGRHADLPWAQDPRAALEQAKHRELVRLTKDLNASDRGNLAEDWYRGEFAKDGHAHVAASRGDMAQHGITLEGDRFLDLVINSAGSAEVREIKNITAGLGDRELSQFRDLVRLLDGGAPLWAGGDGALVKHLRYVFLRAEGARANLGFMRRTLAARGDGAISFEVFNKSGSRRVVRTVEDLADPQFSSWLGL